MSPPHWFLGKGQGPLRDGRPSFEEELAKMPPIADSCYRREVHLEPGWLLRDVRRASARLAQWAGKTPRSPEPDEPSPD